MDAKRGFTLPEVLMVVVVVSLLTVVAVPKLTIAFQSRFCPRVAMVKRLIDEGRIGQIQELRGRGKEDKRGGSEDLWVLAVLNSPVGWWFAWRKAQHGKDDALRFLTDFVEVFPIPNPSEKQQTDKDKEKDKEKDKATAAKEATDAGNFLSEVQTKLRAQVLALSGRMQSRDLSTAGIVITYSLLPA